MRKRLAAYVAASILAVSMPVAAAEHSHKDGDAQCVKDCLMLVKNCGREVDSLVSRISKLEREIGKGTSAYTGEELRKLELKLKETKDLLRVLTHAG